MAFAEIKRHPYWEALLSEVHARPIEMIPQVCRLRRLILAMPTEAGGIVRMVDRVADFCARNDHPAPALHGRQHRYHVGERQVTWEFHTEFVSLTWCSPLEDQDSWPREVGLEAASISHVVGGVRVDVIADCTIPERLLPGFNIPSLCLSSIEDGKAQIATDFVADNDGFTRLELAAGSLTPLRRSIIARRLLEIDTYRAMAMLGLPLAREIAPALRTIELELSEVVAMLSDTASSGGLQSPLNRLHSLSVRSGQLTEQLDYRFAASQAYGAILRARLSGLREAQTSLGSTLTNFIGNRVEPALGTCAAMEKRLTVFSAKAERVASLLNVKVGIDIQTQNAAVLDNIAGTARSQFHLQRTVEGLSIIAISYYLIGIVNYLFSGPLEYLHWQKAVVTSIVAPVTVLSVWMMMRRIRKDHCIAD